MQLIHSSVFIPEIIFGISVNANNIKGIRFEDAMQRSDHDKSPEGGNDSDAPSPQKHSATALHQPGLAAESLQPLRACSARQGGFCGSAGQFGWAGWVYELHSPTCCQGGLLVLLREDALLHSLTSPASRINV